MYSIILYNHTARTVFYGVSTPNRYVISNGSYLQILKKFQFGLHDEV